MSAATAVADNDPLNRMDPLGLWACNAAMSTAAHLEVPVYDPRDSSEVIGGMVPASAGANLEQSNPWKHSGAECLAGATVFFVAGRTQ